MLYPQFSREAQQDLIDLAEYIAIDNAEAALRVVDAVEETAIRITEKS